MIFRKGFVLALLLIVLVAASWYISRPDTEFTLKKEASFADLTLKMTPRSFALSLGEEVAIDVVAGSGTARVMGVTTHLSLNRSHFEIVSIVPAAPNQFLPVRYMTDPADPILQDEAYVNGTWLFTEQNALPFSIGYVSINDTPIPREEKLPIGDFVLARITLKAIGEGTGQIAITSSSSEATGHNPGSSDVSLAIQSPTIVEYRIGDPNAAATPSDPTVTRIIGTPTPTPTPDPVCDLCGYCDGDTDYPDDYASCTKCLYNAPGPPPTDPRDGYQWTVAGCIESTAGGLVESVTAIVLPTAGGGTLLLLIIGSMMILMSGGDFERIKRGRRLIVMAVGALLLIIFSTAVLEFVGVDIIGIPGFGI